MNLLFIFTSSLFFLWVAREIFTWVALWQHNDYRPDRFFISLNGKKQKRRVIFLTYIFVKWTLFFVYGYIIFSDHYLVSYQYSVFILFLIQSLFVGKEIYTNTLKKPRLTFRAIITILFSFFIILLLFMFPLMENFFW